MIKNKSKLFDWINLKYYKDKRGILLAMQEKNTSKDALPIKIKRIFILKNLNPKLTRGNHTLKTTTQIIFCLVGSCEIELDNGFTKKTIRLRNFYKGVIIPPMVWRTLKNFSKDAIILVIADREYKEEDYIRNYEDFIQQVRRRI